MTSLPDNDGIVPPLVRLDLPQNSLDHTVGVRECRHVCSPGEEGRSSGLGKAHTEIVLACFMPELGYVIVHHEVLQGAIAPVGALSQVHSPIIITPNL